MFIEHYNNYTIKVLFLHFMLITLKLGGGQQNYKMTESLDYGKKKFLFTNASFKLCILIFFFMNSVYKPHAIISEILQTLSKLTATKIRY